MSKYYPLTPICNKEADKGGEYYKALNDALSQDNIKNIAITGPHGSGKSSVLCWCKKEIKKKSKIKYDHIDISLATFEGRLNTKANSEPDNKRENNIPVDVIEKSILEQLLYSVDVSKIPQSRYKRIIHRPLWKITLIVFLWLLCLLTVLFPNNNISERLFQLLQFEYVRIYDFIFAIALVVLVVLSFMITRWLLWFALRIQELKFSFSNVEAKIGGQENKSILNEHLDEILYLFERTQKNVVIIEDLDRFENPEIFTRLRELNFFINNYPKIKNKVTFIYAVKDDMFKDKDRTKFFDFIIPVIPHINPSNAYEKMQECLKEYKFDEKFLLQISLYIDDTRFLLNVANEFCVYYSKHRADKHDIDIHKLFALIVYKNFFPQEFANLHRNKGKVFNLFNKEKHQLIQSLVEQHSQRIEEIEDQIELSKSHYISNLNELNILLWWEVMVILNKESSVLQRYPQIKLSDGTSLLIHVPPTNNELTKVSSEATISYTDGNYGSEDLDLAEVRKSFDYEARKERILTKKRKTKDQLSIEIKRHKEKIQKYVEMSLRELIQEHKGDDIFSEEDHKILKFFIQNGYIAEDYPKYISLFIASTISRKDKDFATSVIQHQNPNFQYEIDNFEEVVKYFDVKNFRSSSILNFSLLNQLTEYKDKTKEYDTYFNTLLKHIASGSKETVDFLKQYIDIFGGGCAYMSDGKTIVNFLPHLIPIYSNFWVDLTEDLSSIEKDTIFSAILVATEASCLKSLNVVAPEKQFIRMFLLTI